MQKTNIEWVRNPDGSQGYTYNPITGCLNGCPYCYARKLAYGRLKPLYLANGIVAYHYDGEGGEGTEEGLKVAFNDPFYPRFWEERLGELAPREWGGTSYKQKPRGIFVCDMGELFGDWIPRKWQEAIFESIIGHPQHRFYLLTKQPQNLIKFSPFPENAWVGVTATNYDSFVDACGILCSLKAKGGAKVTFISLEPLLSWEDTDQFCQFWFQHGGIDWLIIGAQTKPYKPPKIEWVKEIVEAADKAGIKVFLKDNLKPLLQEHFGEVRNKLFALKDEEPEPRQEMPG